MKVHRTLLVVALCGVLAAGIQAAWAQAGFRELPQGKWWKVPRIVKELGLTSAQQREIEEIWSQNRRNLIDLKAQLDRSHLDLSELLSRYPVDESAALEAFDSAADARQAIEKAALVMRIRIKNLLLPEQQEKFESLSLRLRRARPAARDSVGPPAGRRSAERQPR